MRPNPSVATALIDLATPITVMAAKLMLMNNMVASFKAVVPGPRVGFLLNCGSLNHQGQANVSTRNM